MYDYIIAGGGTAGCVLAARLSENPNNQVLLIEAGRDTPPGQEPANILDVFPSSQNDRSYYWPNLTADVGKPAASTNAPSKPYWNFAQARVLGGGGTVMGMATLRGVPADYDAWRAAGCEGWGWDDVLPYFKKVERDLDFGGPMHGADGPIPIRRVLPEAWPPFLRAAGDSLQRLGHGYLADLNGSGEDGYSSLPKACTPTQRVSSALGYLGATARARPNLRILCDAHVESLIWQGKRVEGLTARTAAGSETFLGREVIISAGAIHSPAMLLREGIGPARDLALLGIPVRADRPGVGKNLQNHPLFTMAVYLRRGARQADRIREMTVLFMRYSSGHADCPQGDMVFNVASKTGAHPLGGVVGAVGAAVYKPFSRGSVSLRTALAADGPDARFNALTDPRDLARIIGALELSFRVLSDAQVTATRHEVFFPNPAVAFRLSQPTVRSGLESGLARALFDVAPAMRHRYLDPLSLDPAKLVNDPAALREIVLQQTAVAGHVAGTCRMGAVDDPQTVLDSHCRVLGVEGLRVVDGAAMPILIAANTNLPIQMLAERAAALILADRA